MNNLFKVPNQMPNIGVNMDIVTLNSSLQNTNTSVDSIRGIEVVLEAFVKKVIELFGKNALLSAGYQIGAAPGQKIAQRILAARGNVPFTDPLEALLALFSETKKFFNIQVVQVDSLQSNGGALVVAMKNHCFLRDIIKHRPDLEMGGPLCRINKGYLETALKLLLGGKKVELARTGDEPASDMCQETLRFFG